MKHHSDTTYRSAYGLAAELAEARRLRMQRDRIRGNAAAGEGDESILTEVLRRLSFSERRGRELMAEAVHDALSRRRPRR